MNTHTNQTFAIIHKELIDAIRDSKSLATALLLPIAFAVMSYGSLLFIVDTQEKSQGFTVTVNHIEKIEPIADWLKENDIKLLIQNTSENKKSNAKNKTLIHINIPDQFDRDFRQQKPATIELHYDQSYTQAQAQASRLNRLLMQWSLQNSSLRLLARNVSPDIAQSLHIQHINTTEQARLETKMIASFPIVIMLMAFVGGVGMAAEMAAGERERQSLESLLINPVPRHIIALGKWAAAVIVSTVIASFGVGLQFIAINLAPLAELGLRLELGLHKYALVMLILLPVIGLACALQLFVSFLARSFKDSQSYNSLILMLPMAPGIYLMLNSQMASLAFMLIPILGPQALISDLISGQLSQPLLLAVSYLVNLILTFVLLFFIVKLLKREKLMY